MNIMRVMILFSRGEDLQFVYEVISQVLSDVLMPGFPGARGRDGCCCGQVAHGAHS